MDIDKIIFNKGYNPDNNEKMKAFFPTIVDANGIVKEDVFDEEFAKWIKAFYPFMVKYLGRNETEKFLSEYTYELNTDPIANGKKNSGTCHRKEKKIVSNWAEANIHNASIALLHEAGHAVKMFFGNDELLGAGFLDNESVFVKLDEAHVSQGQYYVESGNFSYRYMNIFGEDLNFKTRSDKYPYYQVYLECLKLLLGKNSDLLDKNAKASSIEEKDIVYQQIKMNLTNNLTPNQFARLIDCLNGLIIHVNYPQTPGDLRSKYQKLVVNMQRNTPEGFEAIYDKNVKVAKSRETYDRSIEEDIDELCLVTLEVLKDRLQSPKYDKFEVLKQIARYFCNIRNSSETMKEQTAELLKLWKNEIESLDINLDSLANKPLTEEDKIVLLTYLFSIQGISIEDLKNTKIIDLPSNVSNINSSENSTYINIGKKGMYRLFKKSERININNILTLSETTEDPFMRGIKFEEVDFIKEFPSGEIRGHLIASEENRDIIQTAIENGKVLLTGSFFEKMMKEKERMIIED